MLTHVVGKCWHALVRDVLALGYRVADIFTTLTLADMVSIVVAAPPGTIVRYFLDDGWTRADHLLATTSEQLAGIAKLPEAYARPGIEQRPEAPQESAPGGGKFFNAEAITWEEADRRDAIRKTGNWKHGPSKARSFSAAGRN